MKCDLLEGLTHLIPGFEHQLRLELIEQLELELPCLIVIYKRGPLYVHCYPTQGGNLLWPSQYTVISIPNHATNPHKSYDGKMGLTVMRLARISGLVRLLLVAMLVCALVCLSEIKLHWPKRIKWKVKYIKATRDTKSIYIFTFKLVMMLIIMVMAIRTQPNEYGRPVISQC